MEGGKNNMEEKGLLVILGLLLIVGFVAQGVMISNKAVANIESGVSAEQVQAIVSDEISKIEIPASISQTPVDIPTAAEIAAEISVESADNALLNEFLESEFSVEYDESELEAEPFALEELEDHDYRVVVDYLKTILAEGEELDEDCVNVDIEDVDVKVTKLDLEDEEDKSARVTFEIEVEYELEEGVRDEFEKDVVVIYDVLFEEGYFSDEEVEFVSIV